MDEPISSTQAANGNVDVPEWMLKRRARQAAAAARSASQTPAMPDVQTPEITLENFTDSSELETAIAVTHPSKAPPAWFRAKPAPVGSSIAPAKDSKAGSEDQSRLAPAPEIQDTGVVLPPIEAEEPELLEWHETLRERWLGKSALRSYAISIFMHVLIALPLSIVVFHQELTDLGVNTLMAVQGEDLTAESLDETPVFQVDTSGGLSSDSLDKMLTASAVSNAFGPSSLKVPEDIGSVSKGEGEGTGDGIGNGLNIGGYKMPEGGKAVNKGSFTAWTVPDDPAPGEDYKIVIQVKYKKRNQKIPAGDITGSVVGTDKFRLMISPHTSEVIADANQVVIFVPGAAARVRDTIRVYSAMLKENQRLEIVF